MVKDVIISLLIFFWPGGGGGGRHPQIIGCKFELKKTCLAVEEQISLPSDLRG